MIKFSIGTNSICNATNPSANNRIVVAFAKYIDVLGTGNVSRRVLNEFPKNQSRYQIPKMYRTSITSAASREPINQLDVAT